MLIWFLSFCIILKEAVPNLSFRSHKTWESSLNGPKVSGELDSTGCPLSAASPGHTFHFFTCLKSVPLMTEVGTFISIDRSTKGKFEEKIQIMDAIMRNEKSKSLRETDRWIRPRHRLYLWARRIRHQNMH